LSDLRGESVADPGSPEAGAADALLVILSGPSGVGKDTIIEALRRRPHEPDYHYVVTCTTRAQRPGEVDGVSYHFMEREAFLALRDAGGLLEANEVHGNWYGTPRAQVQHALADGHDVILKIDVQGAQQVKERVADALLIFLVPPSMETLFARLKSRATETVDELELRQRNAAIELARQDDYDYVVTNETGQVERTAARIDEILAEVHGLHPARRISI
jgi:guanylate kinase